jgi:outer membrane protein assembly factor BamA
MKPDPLARARFPIAGLLCVVLFSILAYAQTVNPPDKCPRPNSPALVRQASPPASPGIQIRIRDIRFDGATKLSLTEQNETLSMLMDRDKNADSAEAVEEMTARVREAWQDRGFFKVNVNAETRELSSDDQTKDVAVIFHINEGEQYLLGAIDFLHETQLTAAQLRLLFPLADGEIFDRWKIAEGLSAIRKAYGEAGFINFVSVPETEVDEQKHLVFVKVDVDEGRQFHISGIEIRGFDREGTRRLLRQYEIEPGALFNMVQMEEFARAANLVPWDAIQRIIDEKAGTVCLVIDGRQAHPSPQPAKE